jgi:hypothetical protein
MSLRQEVARALNAGLIDGCRMRPGETTWEIDAVAGLFRTGLPELHKALVKEMPGMQTRVAGVFCHGRPKVRFVNGSRAGVGCELGDLLLVTRYRNGATISTRALLLQMKKGGPTYPSPRSKEYRQVALYTAWPEFTFFGGLRRNVRPKKAHPGAQYGFLELCDGGCGNCQVETAIPKSTACRGLADLVVDMVHQAGGRETMLPPPDKGVGWDRVIWDLLQNSAGAVYSWKRGTVSEERLFNGGLFVSPTRSQVPLLLESLVASDEFTDRHGLGPRDFTFAAAMEDESLGPPGDGPPKQAVALGPDGGLSVAVVEVEPSSAEP